MEAQWQSCLNRLSPNERQKALEAEARVTQKISANPTVTELSLKNLGLRRVPAVIQQLPQLVSLDLSRNQISDISALKTLTHLTDLHLGNNQLCDASALQDLTRLQTLHLGNNRLCDGNALQNLKHLQTLNLSWNQIRDMNALQGLIQLKTLNLSNNQVQDIHVLQDLTQLKTLNLSNNQIQDVGALQGLTHLTQLYAHNNQIQNFNLNLVKLPNLVFVELYDNPIQNIPSALIGDKQIANCADSICEYQKNPETFGQIPDSWEQLLRSLSPKARQDALIAEAKANKLILAHQTATKLSLNHFGLYRIPPGISLLTQLTWLDCWGNQIGDITALQYLRQVYYLDLGGNQIRDITPLRHLTQLHYLTLDFNPVSDISALETLTQLLRLSLEDTQLQNFNLNLEKLPKLELVHLFGSRIQNISKKLPYCEGYNYIHELRAHPIK